MAAPSRLTPCPLVALARGFARLGTGHGLSQERRDAAARIRAAVAAHPVTVAGRGRFDTEVMSLLGARVFTKSGAEGVFCAALPEAGLGLAVKADDGAGRAAQVMIAALIRRFGGFDEETKRAFHAFRLAAPLELERRRSRAFASRGSAGMKPAPVRQGRMRDASIVRRLLAGAAAPAALGRAGKPSP